MVVLVEERDSVGEEALTGRGEWGSVRGRGGLRSSSSS